jgi:hypothetical protein
MSAEDVLGDAIGEEPGKALRGDSWRRQDIRETVKGVYDGTIERPLPSLGRIGKTERGMFYRGKVSGLHGTAGTGKSMVLAAVQAEQIRLGCNVVHVDYEDDAQTLVERLRMFGLTEAQVSDHLVYIQPQEASADGIHWLHEAVADTKASLVVIDSTGESMGLDGIKPNEDELVAFWHRQVARRTAAVADVHPGVVLIDHVPKADALSLMPIASQRKAAAFNGTTLSLQEAIAFSRAKPGHAKLVCGKDRGGNYHKGQTIAEFHFDGEKFYLDEPRGVTFAADGQPRPTWMMEQVSKYLKHNPGSSKAAVAAAVGHKKETVARALTVLVDEGYVENVRGAGRTGANSYTSLKPYIDLGVVLDLSDTALL